jgi:hypothetical protein
MNAVSPPPAGWYPDPSGRAPFRYWDGARWTEHTDQGTAPSPSPSSPTASPTGSSPVPPPPPGGFGGAAPAFAPAAPAGHSPTAAPSQDNWTAQTFLADLKRLDGFALVVVGAVLFFAFTFLTWSSGKVTGVDGYVSSSANAWNGESIWLIRGWDVNDTNVASWLQGITPDAGSDMIVFLPLALIAAGLAIASRRGVRIGKDSEIVLGASGLLALLLIAEMVHVSGAIDDIKNIVARAGLLGEGDVGIGLYLSTAAAILMAGGAVKHYLAARKATG